MDKREPPGRAAPFFITENCQAPFRKGRLTVLLLEELEHTLRLLIGLREHRLRGLRQNVHFCVLHHHLGHICVADTAVGCLNVFRRGIQVVDRIFQAVLRGAENSALRGSMASAPRAVLI